MTSSPLPGAGVVNHAGHTAEGAAATVVGAMNAGRVGRRVAVSAGVSVACSVDVNDAEGIGVGVDDSAGVDVAIGTGLGVALGTGEKGAGVPRSAVAIATIGVAGVMV